MYSCLKKAMKPLVEIGGIDQPFLGIFGGLIQGGFTPSKYDGKPLGVLDQSRNYRSQIAATTSTNVLQAAP
jgi:hypothetical protein